MHSPCRSQGLDRLQGPASVVGVVAPLRLQVPSPFELHLPFVSHSGDRVRGNSSVIYSCLLTGIPRLPAHPCLQAHTGIVLLCWHWSSREGSGGFQGARFLNAFNKPLTMTWARAWAVGHLEATLVLDSSAPHSPASAPCWVEYKVRAQSLWLLLCWTISISVWGVFYLSWEPPGLPC